jgi:hypothetical protein
MDLEKDMQDRDCKVDYVLLLLLLLLKWAVNVAGEEHFEITNFET